MSVWDAQDNVFIVNRNDMTDKEAEITQQAPPYIEFDPDGNVVNGFGDWKVVPNITPGCTIDYENNFWTTGNGDGIIQKYSHGGKLLMQIGQTGVVDTSDGTLKGRALNSSHTQFYMPSDIAVDPVNGDVYVADGYGNSRIAVFDRSGKFLRQWGTRGQKKRLMRVWVVRSCTLCTVWSSATTTWSMSVTDRATGSKSSTR